MYMLVLLERSKQKYFPAKPFVTGLKWHSNKARTDDLDHDPDLEYEEEPLFLRRRNVIPSGSIISSNPLVDRFDCKF